MLSFCVCAYDVTYQWYACQRFVYSYAYLKCPFWSAAIHTAVSISCFAEELRNRKAASASAAASRQAATASAAPNAAAERNAKAFPAAGNRLSAIPEKKLKGILLMDRKLQESRLSVAADEQAASNKQAPAAVGSSAKAAATDDDDDDSDNETTSEFVSNYSNVMASTTTAAYGELEKERELKRQQMMSKPVQQLSLLLTKLVWMSRKRVKNSNVLSPVTEVCGGLHAFQTTMLFTTCMSHATVLR